MRLGRTSKPGVLAAAGKVLSRLPFAERAGLDEEALARAAAFAALGALLLAASAQGARILPAVPIGAWLGWNAGVALDRRGILTDRRDARAALPDLLDRLTTCVLAGMSVERALRTVARRTRGALGEALADGVRALDLGMTRLRAYEIVAARAGIDEVGSLVAALARAERFGTSVADTLLSQARELRARARAGAEQEARTAPVKLIFPLVFCFLPAFVLLTIAPIAISAVRTIGGI